LSKEVPKHFIEQEIETIIVRNAKRNFIEHLFESIWNRAFLGSSTVKCRSKLHDDESRLIQVVLMIPKMMTKSPRE